MVEMPNDTNKSRLSPLLSRPPIKTERRVENVLDRNIPKTINFKYFVLVISNILL